MPTSNKSVRMRTAKASALGCVVLCFGQACFGQLAKRRDDGINALSAIASDAYVSYCFARVRGLDPERLPPAYLVLRLRVTVSYRNAGTRPMILPLEHERTVFTALKPGSMSEFKQGLGVFESVLNPMNELPADVSPDNPITPRNDFFAVIPAAGEMTPPLLEEITLPVSRKGVFRQYPDLRGHRVYVKLRLAHRELSGALRANLSDRWSRIGVPWTGTLTTNTILVDVPAAPQADPCKDTYKPAHPADPDDRK
jgi:hypothetical protein